VSIPREGCSVRTPPPDPSMSSSSRRAPTDSEIPEAGREGTPALCTRAGVLLRQGPYPKMRTSLDSTDRRPAAGLTMDFTILGKSHARSDEGDEDAGRGRYTTRLGLQVF